VAVDGTGRVIDVLTGARRAIDTGGVIARTGNRFVTKFLRVGEPIRLLTQDQDGGSVRTWITLTRPARIGRVDFA